jgi:hypothetical protein
MAELDERSYRRGLILGLTMAEVMILVLFSLLLIWMFGVRDRIRQQSEARAQKAELDRVLAENKELKVQAAELAELKKVYARKLGSANQIDDLFRELTLSKQQVSEMQEQAKSLDIVRQTLTSLGYPLRDEKTAGESAREIRNKLAIAAAVEKYVREHPRKNGTSDTEIVATLGSLSEIQTQLSATGKDPKSVVTECTNALAQRTECATNLNSLRGRLAYAEQKLASSSRGTEKPACWADQTGKPEYIFDVTLKSHSLVVKDNALPNRRSEEAKLPTQQIKFDTDLAQDEFRAQTRELFAWSEKEQCRFFVRILDDTAAHEKDIYKRQLRTVGEHFYYFEDLSRSAEVTRAATAR